MGDFTMCRSSARPASAAGSRGGAAAGDPGAVAGASGWAMTISGAVSRRVAGGLELMAGFFSRMRRSPCEYSNSSSPCSDINARSRSSWLRSTPDTVMSVGLPRFFLPFMQDLEFEEFPRSVGEDFGVVHEHRHVVLDPNSADAGHIDAGLQGDYVPHLHESLLPAGQPGLFVDL